MRMIAVAIWCCLALAQPRVSDADVERQMVNLKEDAKKFRSSFDSAISKSLAHKTDKEKDGKALVSKFVKQTDTMLDDFRDKRNGDAALQSVLRSSDQIDIVVSEVALGKDTEEAWQKVKAEVSSLSDAFGVGRLSR
ncbi:MAG: hypothetical protein ABJF23_09745 [Bryobacteraceae bacterium]